MHPVYRAGRQLRKLRWIVIPAAVLMVVAGAYGAVVTMQSYGLHPTEGGVLAPFWKRATLAAVFAAVALLALVGTPLFLRIYVTAIDLRDDGAFMIGRAAGHALAVRADEVERASFHGPGGGRTTTTNWTLRLRGRGTLILDAAGDVLDDTALRRLLG